MTAWRKLTNFLGLQRNTALLLAALVLAGTGEKLWLGFAPKYLETLAGAAGHSAAMVVLLIGLFDALQTFLGAVYAYPGGWLSDHWGQRRSLLLFNFISLAGYGVVLVWPHWLALLLGSLLFLAWSALSLPATFTVVASSLLRHQHTMGLGVQSLVRRVPMMLGPFIGGALIHHLGWRDGVRCALLLCVGLGALTVVFQWFLLDSRPAPAAQAPPAVKLGFVCVVKSFSPTLRELLISDILIRFCERIPFAFVILWVVNHAGLSAQEFSYLVVVEMVTAMVCYIPVAHLADKHGRRPFVLATFGFFTLFPLAMLPAQTFAWLALAFAIRGLKEFGEPARKALILGEAAPELRGRTYGAYYLIRDCVVTTGSFLGAWLWQLSPQANFLGAAACGTAGTLWFWWFVYRRP